VNFARNGNPNGEGLENWPQYSASEDCYLEIKATPVGTNCGIRKEKLDLWEKIAGFTGCLSTGLQMIEVEDDIQLYPNPADDIIYFSRSENEIIRVSLVNSIGQTFNVQTNSESIDITELKPGLFFVRFETEKGLVIKKLIIHN
jgi:hypothetical protein